MISWLKDNLNQRLKIAEDKYQVSNKSNDTYVMTGMRFVIKELSEIIGDISEFEEREWRYKTLVLQIKKELHSYSLNQDQVELLARFIMEHNLSVHHCHKLMSIFLNKEEPKLLTIEKKEE